VRHEHLTLSICKKALDELEATWPDGAYTLMHLWTAKLTPYACGWRIRSMRESAPAAQSCERWRSWSGSPGA
jgi:hypothetical protein